PDRRTGTNRKPIVTTVAKGILSRGRGGCIAPDDRLENTVHESQDLLRGSKTDGDRLPRQTVGPQRLDERRRFVNQRDVGVAKPVNRLLPVADDENRRREGIVGRPKSFAPALAELPHELPLRAAGVLKLIDEHVTMARFET